MSGVSSRAIAYSFLEFLNNVDTASLEDASKLEVAKDAISGAFGVDINNVSHTRELAYPSMALGEIFAAGVESLGGETEQDQITSRQDFKIFLKTVTAKGVFKDHAVGSPEYKATFEKIVAKFSEKLAKDSTQTPRTIEPVRNEDEDEDETDPEAEAKAEAAKAEGNAYIQTKDYKKAEQCYSRAIDLCPSGKNSHIYFCNRAAARCFLNDWEEAISDCLSSIDLDSEYTKAYARLGFAYYNTEDWQAAVTAYKKAVELDPSNVANKDSLTKAENKLKSSSQSPDSGAMGRPGGPGGFDMSALAGMMGGAGGAGGGNFASLLQNPELMKMAQDPAFIKMAQGMMSNPAMMKQMQQMMGGGQGGGMPDMSAMASMMGNMGMGVPQRPPPATNEDKELTELKQLMEKEGPMAVMQKVSNNPRLQAKVMKLMQDSGIGGMS